MATYYVKTGGNDASAGTSDGAAWANCPGMVAWSGTATLSSGDIVYFHEGDTWEGADSDGTVPVLETTAGVKYYGLGYGTAGTRAILKSISTSTATPSVGVVNVKVSNVTVDSIEVDANEKYAGGIYVGLHATAAVSNVTVNNCVVHNVGNSDFDAALTKYLYGIIVGNTTSGTASEFLKTENIIITNNTVYNVAHEGIAVYPSRQYSCWVDNVLIRGNTVYNTGHWGGATWGHGIDAGIHSTNITIEFNYVYNTYAGISVFTYSDKHDPPETLHDSNYPNSIGFPDNVIIRYNIVDRPIGTGYPGITFGPINNTYTGWGTVYVYSNILMDGGFYMGGGNFVGAANLIYNNTIRTSLGSIARGLYLSEAATNVEGIQWKNNIVYSTAGSAYLLYDYGGLLSASQHSKNMIYVPSGNVGWVYVDGSRVQRTMANIATWEGDIVAADPTFTGGTLPTGFSGTYGTDMVPNTTYFLPQAGSLALNNGVVLGSPYNKAINNAGTSDSAKTRGTDHYDIGAYEYPLSDAAAAAIRAIFRIGGKNRFYYTP
ncbi:MAG: right-handed parallel beta-helix repeat-containing protein [Smithella sp.]